LNIENLGATRLFIIGLTIKKGNQCCIDIKNLIVAAETYKDPVAIETLELIKNHLKEEEG
jgi:hypothetical protein